MLQAGLFSVLLSLRSSVLSVCEGSTDVEFFLAYAAHIQALQSSSETKAALLQWCLIDRRIACYPLVAAIYLRKAREAFEAGDREDCLGEGTEED